MASKLLPSIDFQELQEQLKSQFLDLDPRDPSRWPTIPRYSMFLVTALVVIIVLWFFWLGGSQEDLQAQQAKEIKLRDDYKAKLTKAVNLDVLKKQREQVQQYVTQLEKQLPSKAEMDALLSDINQAGLGRSLQFELFRPGQIAVKEYYAELPIALKDRFIFECWHGPIEKGFEIDHINRNKLDNKIDNLRCITIEENRKNRDHTNIIKFARILHTLKRFIKSINVDTNEINCFKSKYQCGMYYGVSPALVYLIAENKNLAKTANTNKGKIKFEYVDEKDVCNLVEIPHARIGKTYKKLKVT